MHGTPQCRADHWVIPCPSPGTIAMMHNINRDSTPFLRGAGIAKGSKEHKELMSTVRALHRQYLHPFKYVEEQAPDRVDQLIQKARFSLPWLDKYEDNWPARIYLKRYVDTKRPHLMCPRYELTGREPKTLRKACLPPTRNPEDLSDKPSDHDPTMSEFLSSLKPSLGHHLNAFVKLGIKDQETLRAFLSWPQSIQTQFLDDNHELLQLTSLERKAFMIGCGLVTQKVLEESLMRIVKPGNFSP